MLDTCAVDGLCATACPVDINTGDLVKRLRRENHSPFENKIALTVAKNFRTAETLTRFALNFGQAINAVLGRKAMTNLTTGIRRLIPAFPKWSMQLRLAPSIPKGNIHTEPVTDETHVVYFPACISRVMGRGVGDKLSIMETFISVSQKAGLNVIIPEKLREPVAARYFLPKDFHLHILIL